MNIFFLRCKSAVLYSDEPAISSPDMSQHCLVIVMPTACNVFLDVLYVYRIIGNLPNLQYLNLCSNKLHKLPEG